MALQLVSYTKEQLKEILILIGEDINKSPIGKCKTCKENLTLDNIGFIARGDNCNLLYCDNSPCYAVKVTEKYINSEEGEQ